METLGYWIGMVGTFAFAVTAVLAVAPRGVDVFGATVLGLITAIGGGTIRDVTVQAPVFWARDLAYVWVAIGASLLAFAAHRAMSRRSIRNTLLYLDGLGAALFGVLATEMVWSLDFGRPLAPILLGVVTAIGGGLIRDVLAGRQTLLMSRELYAIPILVACTLEVVLLTYLPGLRLPGTAALVLVAFGLRAAAIRWSLAVPIWLTTHSKED
jgi:uncharacterized membrane protein YeiH